MQDILPQSLTHLTVGHFYNYSLDYLPQGILYLDVGSGYNQPLINLPNTLQTLIIGHKYNETLDMLPESVENLNIIFYKNKINKLPQNLKIITININSYKYINDLIKLKPDLVIKNFM